jgi:hypothetical protein
MAELKLAPPNVEDFQIKTVPAIDTDGERAYVSSRVGKRNYLIVISGTFGLGPIACET